jgi:hypothetical protein
MKCKVLLPSDKTVGTPLHSHLPTFVTQFLVFNVRGRKWAEHFAIKINTFMVESFILSHFALRQLFTQIQICMYWMFLPF